MTTAGRGGGGGVVFHVALITLSLPMRTFFGGPRGCQRPVLGCLRGDDR